jgi:hypothetical protein
MSMSAMSISQGEIRSGQEESESEGQKSYEGPACSLPESPNLDNPAATPNVHNVAQSPSLSSTHSPVPHMPAAGQSPSVFAASARLRSVTPTAAAPSRASPLVPVPITKLDIESRLLGRSLRGLAEFNLGGLGGDEMEPGSASGVPTSGADKTDSDGSDFASEDMDVDD